MIINEVRAEHFAGHSMSVIHRAIAYIGVGSNLQDPSQQVKDALVALDLIPETRCIQSSSLYRSKPMGSTDQPDYINAVVELETSLSARKLLQQLQNIEDRHGRIRGAGRWDSRTLDLDILLFNQEVIDSPDLKVPHSGMHERAFVLYPLYEITSDLQIPGQGSLRSMVKTLEKTMTKDEELERLQ